MADANWSDGNHGPGSVLSQRLEVWGISIRFVDIGHGPAVVLIHGTGGSWEVWRANIGELAGRQRVIAVDLPGFGESAPLDGRPDPAAHAEVISKLLRILGVEPATVVGHSLGGLVCLHLALCHPEQVVSLVLVDSGGLPMPGHRVGAIAAGLQVVRILMRSRCVTEALRNRAAIRNLVLGFVVRNPGAIDAKLLDGAFLSMRAPGVGRAITAAARDVVVHRLGYIRQPTLLLWGEFDRLLPVRLAHDMADLIPNSQLKIIEGCGHSPNIESPKLFNAELSRWLQSTQLDVQSGRANSGPQTESKTIMSAGGIDA